MAMAASYEIPAPHPMAELQIRMSCVALAGQALPQEVPDRVYEEVAKLVQLTGVLNALALTDQLLLGGAVQLFEANRLFDTRHVFGGLQDSLTDAEQMALIAGIQLEELKVTPLSGGGYEVETFAGFVQILVTESDAYPGSCWLTRALRILVPDTPGEWRGIIYSAILGNALAGQPAGLPETKNVVFPTKQVVEISVKSTTKERPSAIYVCSLNAHLEGDREAIYEAAIDQLTGATAENPVFPRQACLKAAGFYEGEIDGKRGKLTEAAEEAFRKAHDLAYVDWNSRNLARFLLQTVARGQNAALAASP